MKQMTLSETLAFIYSDINELKEKVEEILGQKRQLEQLLGRWSNEIKDEKLRADIMKYLYGDIACDERISPSLNYFPVDSIWKQFEEADDGDDYGVDLVRTRTCEPISKRQKLPTVVEE